MDRLDNGPEYKPSKREIEVLQAILDSGTAEAAAKKLYIDVETVRTHLRHLRERTDIHHLPQLLKWALHHGYLHA